LLRPAVACLFAYAAAAVAAAAEPARFLAVTVTAGFRHGSITTGEAVLEEIGRTSGLFHVDFLRMPPGKQTQPPRPKRAEGTTDDDWNAQQRAFLTAQERFKKADDAWRQTLQDAFSKAFSAESLASFDGVMFVNTSGKLPVPDLVGLLDWVGTGKAFIGIHAATDTFKDSDAYADFIGGIFAGHPWRGGETHAFVAHEPAHPVTAMFEPRFRWKDEIYQYDQRYEPENVRVLVSLDMTASRPKEPWHVPVSWVREHGKGRVFYTNFGHNDATWKNPTFQKHLLEGTAWALGRIDGPAAPNPAVQATEYLRSVIAAASDAMGHNPADLLAKADGKLARDPEWALGLRPQLVAIRGLEPKDRAAAYRKVLDEVAR
jgi:type 1 glutamine amidotransferase